MDDNTYKRVISRYNAGNTYNNENPYNANTSRRDNEEKQNAVTNRDVYYYSRSLSSDIDYSRKKNINLKQIKNVGLSCAKNITNKLISLSNNLTSGSHSSSSKAPYTYNPNTNKYTYNTAYSCGNNPVPNPQSESPVFVYSNQPKNANNIYTINNIIDRVTNGNDQIRTHRELVIIIEYCLTFKDYLVEINIEKDRFGSPTIESINRFSIINKTLLAKIVNYIRNRKDCCIFTIKFITWKMRCTKKPEEVILSIELLFNCINEFGGYFLVLFTKSLMKTLRKLLFITNFKNTLTSNVKKKITKILGKQLAIHFSVGKTNYVHPGISTDIRIHIFKSKILYNIQLYYEIYLFEQDQYVVFYDGYKDMRLRGVKFPIVKEDKVNLTNLISTNLSNAAKPGYLKNKNNFESEQSLSYANERIYRELNLDMRELDELLYNINNNNYDTEYIDSIRNKLINSINILSNRTNLNKFEVQILDKILKLNDSLLLLKSNTIHPTAEVTESHGTNSQAGEGTSTSFADLLLDDEISYRQKPESHEGRVEDDKADYNLDDIFNFINFNKDDQDVKLLSDASEDEHYESDEDLINNFINFKPKRDATNINTVNTTQPSSNTVNQVDSVNHSDTVKQDDSGDLGDMGNVVDSVNGVENSVKEEGEAEGEKVKGISELVLELENLEMDFGHMSVNNF